MLIITAALRLVVRRGTSLRTSNINATSFALIMSTSYRWLQESEEQDKGVLGRHLLHVPGALRLVVCVR